MPLNKVRKLAKSLIYKFCPGYSFRFFPSCEFDDEVLGCCCWGLHKRVELSRTFAKTKSKDEIYKVLLHEIAHAINTDDGHKQKWRDTCLILGGDGKQFYEKLSTE